jgi:hypothetical protein
MVRHWLPAALFLYALSTGSAMAHGGRHFTADTAAPDTAASASHVEHVESVPAAIPFWAMSCPHRNGDQCCHAKPSVCSGDGKAFLLSRPAWRTVDVTAGGSYADRFRNTVFPFRLPASSPPRAPPPASLIVS